MNHNKISFVREYCRCRRIPYMFKGKGLFILHHGKYKQIWYSVYNLTYIELITVIDRECIYDYETTFFIGLKEA